MNLTKDRQKSKTEYVFITLDIYNDKKYKNWKRKNPTIHRRFKRVILRFYEKIL